MEAKVGITNAQEAREEITAALMHLKFNVTNPVFQASNFVTESELRILKKAYNKLVEAATLLDKIVS